MRTVVDLLTANLFEVFGNRDSGTRRATIEQIYTRDVIFTDPEGVTRGWDALEEKARGLLDRVPSTFAFAADGERYAGPQTGALAWTFGPEGEPVARGIDVITVRDERIATITTMFVA